MNIKTGHCPDCPEDAADAPLIAKRCQTHYWKHRSKVNADKPRHKEKKATKQALGTFFAKEILQIPRNCEECGDPLPTSGWMARACVAHILPKSIFQSVMIHPQNKWFACIQCHTDFDNRGSQHVITLKVLPMLKERVQILLPLLTPEELRRVPEYYL